MVTQWKTHGAFSWNELSTTDVAGAKKFYSKLFDWKFEEMKTGEMDYTVVKYGGEQMGGINSLPPQAKGVPPHWGVYVTVEDTDKTVKLAEKLGGKVIVPPTDIPKVGRFALIQDPQGAAISIIKYTNPDM